MSKTKDSGIQLTEEELELAQKGLVISRALFRGELDYRGRQSFKPIVDFSKNPRRACELKKHFEYGTCAYELAGYLESEEERIARPDRFIFHSMDTMMKGCFKGERAKGKNFSERDFYYAVKLFRDLGILSPRVRRDGHDGVIVAPHSSLFVRLDKQCCFYGITVTNRAKEGLVGAFEVRPNGAAIWHNHK